MEDIWDVQWVQAWRDVGRNNKLMSLMSCYWKLLAYKNIGKRKDISPTWCLSFGADYAIFFLQVDAWWGHS